MSRKEELTFEEACAARGAYRAEHPEEKLEKIEIFCPCCERIRPEEGSEFEGEILCSSCIEGLVEY